MHTAVTQLCLCKILIYNISVLLPRKHLVREIIPVYEKLICDRHRACRAQHCCRVSSVLLFLPTSEGAEQSSKQEILRWQLLKLSVFSSVSVSQCYWLLGPVLVCWWWNHAAAVLAPRWPTMLPSPPCAVHAPGRQPGFPPVG